MRCEVRKLPPDQDLHGEANRKAGIGFLGPSRPGSGHAQIPKALSLVSSQRSLSGKVGCPTRAEVSHPPGGR